MRKAILLLLLLVVGVFAQYQEGPSNSKTIVDTLWISGTDTVYSRVFWQDMDAEKTVMFCVDDTSAAGFGGDSIDLDCELMQVVASDNYESRRLWMFTSDAQAEIFTDLTVANLDTTSKYSRGVDYRTNASGDTVDYTPNNEIGSLYATAEACSYYYLLPDATPGIAFMIYGGAGNKTGSDVMVIVRYTAITGAPVDEVD